MISLLEAKKILQSKQKKDYPKVEKLLDEASKAYYNSDIIILTDSEYDDLYKLYYKTTGKTIYGAKPEGKGLINVKHDYENLVGTLFKLFNLEDCKEFVNKMINYNSNKKIFQVFLSLKFDGNSVTIEYDKDGKVIKALTRGRNGEGKDLTHVFKNRKVKKPSFNSEFAVKYEAIVTYEDYDRLCKEFDADYANPRSLISGILGKDVAIMFKDYITLVPLQIRLKDYSEYENKYKSLKEKTIYENELISKLFGEENYFTNYSKMFIACSSRKIMENIVSYYNNVIKIRPNLPFMIDGIVIDFVDDILREMGYTSLSDGSRPYFKQALKLPYLEKVTKVTDIKFSFGDSGRITPVVHFEPVEFLGNVQRKQNIHNYKRFKELALGKGSEILLTYRSDCLTYVNKINNDHNKNIKPFKFIQFCPECGEELKIIVNEKGEETFVECPNPCCYGKIVGTIQNFLIKMNIKGIKENTIEKLRDNNLVEGIIDLYEINIEEVSKIKGLGPKTAELIKKSLDNKVYYDYEILGSVGIKNISLENAKIISKKYTIQDLVKLNCDKDNFREKLEELEGFSTIQANNFINGFNENLKTIFYLDNRGCKVLKNEIVQTDKALNIVFTGFRDKDFQTKLEMMGHSVKSSVSGKTDIVVAKDKNSNSTKMKDAREKRIKIMSYEEALNYFS